VTKALLAGLMPPPRLHRHRYHGVLAPNAQQPPLVTALAREPAPPLPNAAYASHAPARYLWAVLLARIFEGLPLRCELSRAQKRVIACATDPPAVQTILAHLGEPTTAPQLARAPGRPLWEQAPETMGAWDEAPAPVPGFVFDQRLSW
jgi:hypothetical protein